MTRPGRLCTNVSLSLTCCAEIGGALQPWLEFYFIYIVLFARHRELSLLNLLSSILGMLDDTFYFTHFSERHYETL